MRCTTCDYPLWQIKARQCPECGSPFKPSDFRFVINSVQFCCPHCGQDYYGTGPTGHLQPTEFDCQRCGRRITMDETVLLPTSGVSEVATAAGRNPWVERRDNSWMGAWFRTIGMAIGGPRPLGKFTPASSTARRAFWFAVLTMFVYIGLSGLWLIAFPFFMIGGMAAGRGVGFFVAAIAVFAAVPVCLIVVALLVHGVLRLTGPTERGLKGTAQAVWYTSAVNAPTAIPCLSFYVAWLGWVWWAIAAGFTLQAIQKCKPWRAAIAVLIPTLLIGGSLVGGIVYSVLQMQSFAARAGGMVTPANVATVSASAGANIALMGQAIRSAALATPPTLPRHAIEMLDANRRITFVDTPTMEYSIVIAGQNAGSLGFLPAAQKQPIIAAIAQSLPPNTVAHRLGDYVFSYNGVDLTTAPGGVWTAIYWPNPDWSPLMAGRTFHAACVDGSTQAFATEAAFDTALQAQNALRKTAGLAPLPHPKTVTHATPAVGAAPDPSEPTDTGEEGDGG